MICGNGVGEDDWLMLMMLMMLMIGTTCDWKSAQKKRKEFLQNQASKSAATFRWNRPSFSADMLLQGGETLNFHTSHAVHCLVFLVGKELKNKLDQYWQREIRKADLRDKQFGFLSQQVVICSRRGLSPRIVLRKICLHTYHCCYCCRQKRGQKLLYIHHSTLIMILPNVFFHQISLQQGRSKSLGD